MLIVIVHQTPPKLRGVLSRWLLELHPGVFIGTANPRLTQEIRAVVEKLRGRGTVWIVTQATSELGIEARKIGPNSLVIQSIEDLLAHCKPNS